MEMMSLTSIESLAGEANVLSFGGSCVPAHKSSQASLVCQSH